MIWTLSIVALAFGVPIVLYEQCVHRPAVNREMERFLAEPGAAPNGAPATPAGNPRVTEGPPSVS